MFYSGMFYKSLQGLEVNRNIALPAIAACRFYAVFFSSFPEVFLRRFFTITKTTEKTLAVAPHGGHRTG